MLSYFYFNSSWICFTFCNQFLKKKTTKNDEKTEKIVLSTDFLNKAPLKTFFLDFEALWDLFGALLDRFGVDFGSPGGSQKGSKIETTATRPAIMVPSALGKASGTDFGWILEVLGWFRDGFRGDFGWSWQFFLYRFSGKRKKTKFKTGLQDWISRLEFKTGIQDCMSRLDFKL